MEGFQAAEVFADGDELHLGSDDALLGIPFLGDGMAGTGAEGLAAESGIFLELVFGGLAGVVGFGVLVREVAIVLGLDVAALVFFYIFAFQDPVATEGRETLGDVSFEARVAPGTRAIIDADGGVFFHHSVGMGGFVLADFAHGDSKLGMNVAFDVDSGGVGKIGGIFLDGFDLGGVIDVLDEVSGVVGTLMGVFGSESLILFVEGRHGVESLVFEGPKKAACERDGR